MGSVFSGPKIKTGAVNKSLAATDKLSSKVGKMLQPINISGGGLTSNFSKGSLSVNADTGRTGLVSDLSNSFTGQADLLSGLRSQIAPGVSALRAAQLASIEGARQSAVSTLADNLARRRVLGSSFGADALTRSNLDFEKQKNDIIAQTYLQEIDATNQLINQEFTARQNAFSTKLDEANLEAGLAKDLSAQASDILTKGAEIRAQLAQTKLTTTAQIATDQAKLDAGAQSGAGSLFGLIGQKVLGPTLSGVGTNVATALL